MDYTPVWHWWSNEFLRGGDGEQAIRSDAMGLLERGLATGEENVAVTFENQFVIHGAPPR